MKGLAPRREENLKVRNNFFFINVGIFFHYLLKNYICNEKILSNLNIKGTELSGSYTYLPRLRNIDQFFQKISFIHYTGKINFILLHFLNNIFITSQNKNVFYSSGKYYLITV